MRNTSINFQFPDPKLYKKHFTVFLNLVDIEGRRYEAGHIIEQGLEPEFAPFDELNIYPTKRQPGLLNKFKNIFD